MSSMAHKPGVYRDFTGRINYYGSICAVKNATFELLDGFKRFKGEEIIRIEFKKGVVISGGLVEADIESCEFRGRKLDRSVFRDGVFAGKEFSKSYWLGGEWMGEKWSDSYDKFGRQRLYAPPFWNEFDEVDGIITQWGRYKNFTGRVKYRFSDFYIENGELEIGRHHNRGMIIDGGTITEGNLSGAIINYVVFNGDDIFRSIWREGTFDGNSFNGDHWWSGIWLGGEWNGGIYSWAGGFDKHGNYRDKNDPPNKWNI